MSRLARLGFGLLAFVLAGLLLWGLLAWRDRETLKRLRAEMGIAARDTVIARQTAEVARVDTIYRETVREYPVYRDRLVAANPGNKPLAELAGRCDQLVVSCEQRVAAGDVLADTLRAQIAALKKMKAIKPPRFSAFAEGGWDVVHKEPIARGGGEVRVLGPFSLTLTGETSFGLEESRQRVIVSGKFVFR